MTAVVRLVATLGFVAALGVAAVAAGVGSADRATRHHFSHVYPPNPRSFERPKVTDPVPRAPAATTVRGLRVTSLASLAYVLPRGTLVHERSGAWRLNAPVDVTKRAAVALGGGTLELAPGTFLQARAGGSIALSHMTVQGVTADGRLALRPNGDRGFLVARDGGRLVLRGDRIRFLGHLGTVAYGISFRASAPGSTVTASTVDGDYFGVFLSHAAGVVIASNTIANSVVYGVDPFGDSHDVLVAHNTISRPGLHGIVLARGVARIRVIDNHVIEAGAHGIVLYAGAHASVVRGNTVTGAFDGIVITDSSGNRVERNAVRRLTRFGLRVSGASHGNVLSGNSFADALVGAYFYGGASGNALTGSVFASNAENVRVRADAAPVVVVPKPPLSELP